MKLAELHKSYDLAFSLGSNCEPTYQLRRHHLRRCAGPLDWFVAGPVKHLCEQLDQRFAAFMQLEHLEMIRPLRTKYAVVDRLNKYVSYHDFSLYPDGQWQRGYPEFRAKLDRRVERFYAALEHGERLLFLRTHISREDALQLQTALSKHVKGQFELLVVNPAEETSYEDQWQLDGICSILMRKGKTWSGCDEAWERVFQHITVNPEALERKGLWR